MEDSLFLVATHLVDNNFNQVMIEKLIMAFIVAWFCYLLKSKQISTNKRVNNR
jgi:hypothetical protein